ncbi:helix-turn-helix transcriptional regulator [Clostridium sp. SY8519]|uniref:helix-turn-helix domain-containing protein n=1 Tax=Clostridium sp. (strain SY8519) TaxID=1042156 RepID=UPI00325B6D96
MTVKTANEINTDIAKRLAKIRRRKGFSQKKLAARSGVSLGSLKRFEQTGEVSLHSLTKMAIALGLEEQLLELFADIPPATIEEVIREQG